MNLLRAIEFFRSQTDEDLIAFTQCELEWMDKDEVRFLAREIASRYVRLLREDPYGLDNE